MAAPTEQALLCARALGEGCLGVSLPAVYLEQIQYSGLAYVGSGTPRHRGMARPVCKGSSPGHGCSFRAGSSRARHHHPRSFVWGLQTWVSVSNTADVSVNTTGWSS